MQTIIYCVCQPLSCVRLFATPRTVACQAPLSVEFSRQEYWSGLPFPSPGDLPDLGIKPWSSALQADSLPSELAGKPQLVQVFNKIIQKNQNEHSGQLNIQNR